LAAKAPAKGGGNKQMSDELSKPELALGLAGLYASPLDAILQQYDIENRVYKNVQINLDGYTFRNCAFIGCALHTSKGNFHIVDCHVANCSLYFMGNAARSVKLSSMLHESWNNLFEGIRPKVEPDGGVTIL
jgi:hypothetical protein